MTPEWLSRMGFLLTGEMRKPALGEWYINKNTDLLCFVYDEASKPCDCPKCNNGERQLAAPVGGTP